MSSLHTGVRSTIRHPMRVLSSKGRFQNTDEAQ